MGMLPFFIGPRLHQLDQTSLVYKGTYVFLLGAGGRARASVRRIPSNCFTNLGRQTCFTLTRARGTVFLGKEKFHYVASILYLKANLPVKINPNYLQVW